MCFLFFARETAGASSARHSLRPLMFQVRFRSNKTRAGMRSEIGEVRVLRGGIGELCVDEAASAVRQLVTPSWPGLSRPSTLLLRQQGKDVDGRDKPGHDGVLPPLTAHTCPFPTIVRGHYSAHCHRPRLDVNAHRTPTHLRVLAT